MRALQVNGEMLDLMGKVERGEVTYGVSAGLFSLSPRFCHFLKNCSKLVSK